MKKNKNEWFEFWFDVLKLFIIFCLINIGFLFFIFRHFK